jgi:decaheme cytochrome c component MtrC/MtrF-like protein/Big-like domain-containing protein
MNSHPKQRRALQLTFTAVALACAATGISGQGQSRIVAWNDLGMHCMDPDFSVFSLLPPYNTLNSQLMVNGVLQAPGVGYTITYSAGVDPSGSINRTSIGKTNFWDYAPDLFGVVLAPDVGLAGYGMPGPSNVPQWMSFDPAWNWYHAVGIPITPFDDAQHKNPYGLMSVVARNAAGQVVASTVTTIPVSQEMTCTECHASYSNPYARPRAGWANHPDPLKDDRLNILRLHDEREAGNPAYASALATAGYAPTGLLDTVLVNGTSVLCDRCHLSNALGIGMLGIEPMTQAIHSRHASVIDTSGAALGSNPTRSACYSCHPGFDTQCLRGAMGKAIGANGLFSMQCQSCHGDMSAVGAATRNGWFEEPNCQSCHTGSATHNNGQIRYTSVFDSPGHERQAVSSLFATTPGVPVGNYSLYRFSSGHGGLQCSACHGPPHAIYPTSVANDNLQSLSAQGHEGMLIDCNACHATLEDSQVQGPHGMHPVNSKWVVDLHGGLAQTGLAGCLACHNGDAKGSVLSRAQGNRTFATPFGAKQFWRGFQVSCYACHNGPTSDDPTPNLAPVVASQSRSTPSDVALPVTLGGTDANGDPLSYRIVSQAAHGKVALSGASATYRADTGFVGADSFTFAAWDGKTNSNLGSVMLTVGAPACAGSAEAFGFGSAGTGGFLPRLSMTGCATPGGQGTMVLEGALGGTVAWLLAGPNRAQREYAPGSVLRFDTLVFQYGPIPVTGSGPGQGGFVLPFTIPPTAPLSSLVFQAFVRDPAARLRLATTNGVEVVIR